MIRVGVLTISDGAARGERQDVSGENIRTLIAQLPDVMISARGVIPDEHDQIMATLRAWSELKAASK